MTQEHKDKLSKAGKEKPRRRLSPTAAKSKAEKCRAAALRQWADPAKAETCRQALAAIADRRKAEREPMRKAKEEARQAAKAVKQAEKAAREKAYKEMPSQCGRPRPVLCITTGKEYPTATMAERELGIHRGNVTTCCRRGGSAKGYTFRYI